MNPRRHMEVSKHEIELEKSSNAAFDAIAEQNRARIHALLVKAIAGDKMAARQASAYKSQYGQMTWTNMVARALDEVKGGAPK